MGYLVNILNISTWCAQGQLENHLGSTSATGQGVVLAQQTWFLKTPGTVGSLDLIFVMEGIVDHMLVTETFWPGWHDRPFCGSPYHPTGTHPAIYWRSAGMHSLEPAAYVTHCRGRIAAR
jgi:hypothetical protein